MKFAPAGISGVEYETLVTVRLCLVCVCVCVGVWSCR